jgi:hypothetical protein
MESHTMDFYGLGLYILLRGWNGNNRHFIFSGEFYRERGIMTICNKCGDNVSMAECGIRYGRYFCLRCIRLEAIGEVTFSEKDGHGSPVISPLKQKYL